MSSFIISHLLFYLSERIMTIGEKLDALSLIELTTSINSSKFSSILFLKPTTS